LPQQWFAAAALIPVIRMVGDVAKMMGYPVGIWWRIKNKGQVFGLKRKLQI
jgi:hypothetical protein